MEKSWRLKWEKAVLACIHHDSQPANHANEQKYAKRCALTSFAAKGRFIIIKNTNCYTHTFFPVYPLNYCTPRKMWRFKIFFYTSSILQSSCRISITTPLERLPYMHVYFLYEENFCSIPPFFWVSKHWLMNYFVLDLIYDWKLSP